jgi:steroid 5-alpha reductase family enzyme
MASGGGELALPCASDVRQRALATAIRFGIMGLQRSAIASAVIAGAVIMAGAVAWAGSQGGAELGGIPVMVLSAAIAFVVQWLAFVPAYWKQTEHFYDLAGSLTYMLVTGFALVVSRPNDARSAILGLLVFIWASRLGSFLFRRVRSAGSDPRFDEIKPSASRFLVAWTLQGLWVFLTLCAALAAITTMRPSALGLLDGLGVAIWVVGFAIEVTADRQKSGFRANNPGHYVHTGLWAWSRHPNYFGEIVLWIGIAIIASSTLRGWQWVTMISPVFVIFLLTRMSGIPLLEKRADERWGDHESYQSYKAKTPALVPRPPRR